MRGLCLGFFFSAILIQTSGAQSVPSLVNYQGRLSNPDGSPLATADYQLSFSIYDSTNGGNLVWGPQIFDGTNGLGHGLKIPVVQGYFNVMLGPADTNGTSLANAFTNAISFVQITVGTNQPILPCQRILTSPYAFQAGNAAKLAGADWSAVFGTNDPVNGKIPGNKLATNSVIISQQIGVGTGTPAKKLEVSVASQSLDGGRFLAADNHWVGIFPSLAGNLFNGMVGAGDSGIVFSQNDVPGTGNLFIGPYGILGGIRMTADGHVAIGKAAPTTALDVNGTITAVNFTGSGSGLVGLTLSNMAARQISASAGVGGLALSTNSGDFQTTSTTDVVVPNLQVSLACVGGPVEILTLGAGSGLNSFFENNNGGGSASCIISLYRDGTRLVSEWFSEFAINSSTAVNADMPASNFRFIDTPSAGTHTYDLRLRTGAGYARVLNVRLAAREF